MAQNISKNLSFVGQNIRKIRQAKKISQADFAQIFHLARPSIGAYEEGRSEPKIDTLIQIARHFNISVDMLLTRELTVSDIYSFSKVNKKLDQVHKLKESGNSISSTRLVRINQYLDYIVNFNNHDFIHNLEVIGLTERFPGTIRAFEMRGVEMDYNRSGIHHGDILVGKKVEWKQLKELIGTVLSIVHHTNITTMRLSDVTKNSISLSADEPNYPYKTFDIEDILEVWQIIGSFSKNLEPPNRIEERMLKIEEELKKLKKF